MRIIIEAAKMGGYAAFNEPDDIRAPELLAVGEDLQAVCDKIANPAKRTRTVNEWAEMIAACDPSSDQPRKVHMLKLLREITGCGLREGRDALEVYL